MRRISLPGEDLYTLGPRDTLEHLFAQPIANALKFTDPGGAEIAVTLESATLESLPAEHRRHVEEAIARDERLNRNRAAHLIVTDSGWGIAPESLERIFEEGYSTVSNQGRRSSGLGLAMLREHIAAFGGVCRAESTLGKGTTVHVCLPLVD